MVSPFNVAVRYLSCALLFKLKVLDKTLYSKSTALYSRVSFEPLSIIQPPSLCTVSAACCLSSNSKRTNSCEKAKVKKNKMSRKGIGGNIVSYSRVQILYLQFVYKKSIYIETTIPSIIVNQFNNGYILRNKKGLILPLFYASGLYPQALSSY